MENVGLVEEGRKQYKGQYTDKTQWNKLLVGGSEYTVERGRVSRDRINLEEIKWSNAYEKKAHKEMCGLCRMYFEKSSVSFKVPNHRLIDKLRGWNVPIEGRRYQSASFLYSTSNLCRFCAHLFADINTNKVKYTTLMLSLSNSCEQCVSER